MLLVVGLSPLQRREGVMASTCVDLERRVLNEKHMLPLGHEYLIICVHHRTIVRIRRGACIVSVDAQPTPPPRNTPYCCIASSTGYNIDPCFKGAPVNVGTLLHEGKRPGIYSQLFKGDG